MFKDLLTTRTKTGLAIIYLAGLGWTAEIVIPFTKLEPKIPLLLAVAIGAEALFIVGVAVLGRPAYLAFKSACLNYLHRSSKS